ncbi:hypothetical protein QJS10_CPA03g01507 [Acorus calamus]|uniref:Uncharacterized protein n=1 Tax=Acorus calamus TaxID=4465 RepID=A0AAV9F726_ACOCL|nr:hypothetical protein QJS10_CPA03g01507 [Acorus calamus]
MVENDLCTHKQPRKSEEEGMLSDCLRTKPATNQPPRGAAQPPPTSDLDKSGLEWKRE